MGKKEKGPAFEVYQKPDAESLNYIAGKKGPQSKSDQQPPPSSNNPAAGSKASKNSSKTKYIALDAQKLMEGLLPGRHPCRCLASKHKLLTNCLRCGRIVCEQEGPGPCMTCGNEIFDQKQQSRIAQKIHDQLVAEGRDQIPLAEVKKLLQKEEQERKAEEFKNKLLEFDRTSAKRTRVIDDETDYYSSETNTWLSTKEKESLKLKEEAIRAAREEKEKQRRVTIDIAGRRVIDSAFDEEDKESKLRQSYQDEIENSRSDLNQGTGLYAGGLADRQELRPVFVPKSKEKSPPEIHEAHAASEKLAVSRVQHNYDTGSADLNEQASQQDEADQGLCLSMWQPWASLLVHGIKVVEGRSWPTTHRGRLWIAAAAKKPSPEEMRDVIDQHTAQAPADAKLPKIFPSSCLLGCVDIVDCLTQAEYQANVPDPLQRQSESEHVFICKNPRVLPTPLPMSGNHKLFSLEPELHEQCKAQLAKKGGK